jgi:hypothetical protein
LLIEGNNFSTNSLIFFNYKKPKRVMGACCNANSLDKGESFVRSIFLNYSNIARFNYYKLENLLLENSSNNYISKEDYLENILPYLHFQGDININPKETKHFIFIIQKYYECIFHKQEHVNIYFIILIFFPLIRDTHNNLIHNFYKTFSKIVVETQETDASSKLFDLTNEGSIIEAEGGETYKSELVEENFQQLFITYLTFNLRIITLTVITHLEVDIIKDGPYIKEKLNILFQNCFTNENIKDFANKFFIDLDIETAFNKKNILRIDEFKEMFLNKHFLFDFIDLRDNFMNEYCEDINIGHKPLSYNY